MYTRQLQVRFKDCDPAGIVFYPRYFEMINDTVEDFFADPLGYPFPEMMPDHGVPTVAINTEFLAPSFHGDLLAITVEVQRIGRTSMTYEQIARCGDEVRFRSTATLVHTTRAGQPVPWPGAVAAKMQDILEGQTA